MGAPKMILDFFWHGGPDGKLQVPAAWQEAEAKIDDEGFPETIQLRTADERFGECLYRIQEESSARPGDDPEILVDPEPGFNVRCLRETLRQIQGTCNAAVCGMVGNEDSDFGKLAREVRELAADALEAKQ